MISPVTDELNISLLSTNAAKIPTYISSKDEPEIFRRAMEYFGANRNNTVVFEDAIHAVQTAKRDDFKVTAVFDNSEKRQTEIQELCDCYISNFEQTEQFWEDIK